MEDCTLRTKAVLGARSVRRKRTMRVKHLVELPAKPFHAFDAVWIR